MLNRVFYVKLAAAFILSTAVPARAEDDKLAKINQYVDQFLEMIPKGFDMVRNIKLIKEADLSYQNSLTAPVSGLVDCKNKKELGLLLGTYVFDTNYAMVFDKRKEVQDAWESGFQKTSEKLALQGGSGAAMLPGANLKNILDDPANSNRYRDVLIEDVQSQVTAILKKAREKPEFLGVVVDEMYGAIVEGLYVVCKLSLNEDLKGESMVALLNTLEKSLGGYAKVEAIFAGDKDFEMMLDKGSREKVLRPVQEILAANGGKVSAEDLKKILAIIEPVRGQIVKKCS